MGDFNAIIGERISEDEHFTGKDGLGERNLRGHMLCNFLENQQLYAMNRFFPKHRQRKWTWISPDSKTRNEIDYILSSCQKIVGDVTVLNSFNTGSDHRIVRARLTLQKSRKRVTKTINAIDTVTLKEKQTIYVEKLKEKLNENKN